MSAFVCLLDRSGAALDRARLDRLAAALDPFGTETASFCEGPVGIAVRHRGGAAAAELHGPLRDSASGRVVAVAGRLLPLAPPWALAGAALVRQAGESAADLFARTAGAFALIEADPRRGALAVARDHLGSFAVHLHVGPRWFLVASEPAALLADPALSDALDEVAAARFLGFRFANGGRSFFRDIEELPPAHRVEVDAAGVRRERLWRFRPPGREADPSPEEAAAELRAGLAAAVAREIGDLDPGLVALSLGGGLDSTALAALAPPGLRAFSWRFAETPDEGEEANVEAVAEHLGMPLDWIAGDGDRFSWDAWAARFAHPASPWINPFAALKAHLYAAAREAGCARLMVGDGGDALYAADEHWLRDLLAGRRPGALGSLAATLRGGWRGDPAARRALRRLLPVAAVDRLDRRPPRWLTPSAAALLPPPAPVPIVPPGRRWRRYELVAGARNGEIESEERRLFALCGVERSNPFWSWSLVELAAGLPADLLRRDGATKLLTRRALAGRLPERVLASRRVGLLGDFFLRGLAAERERLREEIFRRPRSDWPRYVARAWLEPYLDAESLGFGHTILWRVISYELWQRRLDTGAGRAAG
jgi:asparagine synthase (glutamine-hydrolysing)